MMVMQDRKKRNYEVTFPPLNNPRIKKWKKLTVKQCLKKYNKLQELYDGKLTIKELDAE
tara:strand:+ start:171 stop:347 length:177 start_codon:yes stop_codon:yes gene_type:complete